MLVLEIYLGICAAIFCWFMILGIYDFLFQPTYKSVYESHSFRNRLFWREALWYSLPIVNLVVLTILVYVVVIGYKKD